MNRTNGRIAEESKKRFAGALLELMKTYPYPDITVTQLCQTAGLSRRVFYHLFTGKTDALHACWMRKAIETGPDMPMWGMMQNFSIDMMMGNAPESALKSLNKKLIAFDLVSE